MRNQFLTVAILLLAFTCQMADLHAQWVPMNGPSGGHVTKLMEVDGRLFIGTDAGVYVLSDREGMWTIADTGLQRCSIIALGAMGATLFAAVYDSGIVRSFDNGATWTSVNSEIDTRQGIAMVSRGTDLFIGSRAKVYRTSDSGASWSIAQLDAAVYFITGLALQGSRLYASTSSDGVHVSTDNGLSWAASNQGLTDSVAMHIVTSGANVLVGTERGGVFASIDSGKTWVVSNLQAVNVSSLSAKDTTAFAGVYLHGGYRSTNSGQTWTEVNGEYGAEPQNGFAFVGDDVYVGTDGGVYRTSKNGTYFRKASSGLHVTDVVSLIRHGEYLFAAMEGSGVARSEDSGLNWVDADVGIPSSWPSSFGFSGGKLFVGTQRGVYVTTDDGARWRKEIDPFSTSSTQGPTYYRLYVIEDSLYASTPNGLFVTGTQIDNWVRRGNGLPGASLARNGNTLYSGGVQISEDYGKTWNPGGPGLPGNSISGIVSIGKKILVGTTPGVYVSTDNNVSWRASNTGMEKTTVTSMLLYGANVFASTYRDGVFLSVDSGATWKAMNEGALPQSVASLFVDNGMLYAGTRTAGVWRRPLSEIVTSVNEAVIAVGNCEAAAASIVNIYSVTGEHVGTGADIYDMGLPRGLYFVRDDCGTHVHHTSVYLHR